MLQLTTWCDLVSLRHDLETTYQNLNVLDLNKRQKTSLEFLATNEQKNAEFRKTLVSISTGVLQRAGLGEALDTILGDTASEGDMLGLTLLSNQDEFSGGYKGYEERVTRHLQWNRSTSPSEKKSFMKLDAEIQTLNKCALAMLEKEKKDTDLNKKISFSSLDTSFLAQLRNGVLNDYTRVVLRNTSPPQSALTIYGGTIDESNNSNNAGLCTSAESGVQYRLYYDTPFYLDLVKGSVGGHYMKFNDHRLKLEAELRRLGEENKRMKMEAKAQKRRLNLRATKGRQLKIGTKFEKLDGFMTAVPRYVPDHILPSGNDATFQDELMSSIFKY